MGGELESSSEKKTQATWRRTMISEKGTIFCSLDSRAAVTNVALPWISWDVFRNTFYVILIEVTVSTSTSDLVMGSKTTVSWRHAY